MGAHDGSVRTRPNGPRMQTEEISEALTAGAREPVATRTRPSGPRQLLLRRRGPKGAAPRHLRRTARPSRRPFAHHEGLSDSPFTNNVRLHSSRTIGHYSTFVEVQATRILGISNTELNPRRVSSRFLEDPHRSVGARRASARTHQCAERDWSDEVTNQRLHVGGIQGISRRRDRSGPKWYKA